MRQLFINFLIYLTSKVDSQNGGNTMMAIFIARNIIEGRYTYARTPQFYKAAVAEQLRLLDAEDLIIE